MPDVISRLHELGLALPSTPQANGLYRTAIIADGVLHTSGQLSRVDQGVIPGPVGPENLEAAKEAARICVLRCLAVVHDYENGFASLDRPLLMRGFVATAPGFEAHSKVLDAASELILKVLGDEEGAHARTAVGVQNLPSGGAVEIEMVFKLKKH